MGFKYLNGIPFVHITSGTVETLAPLDSNYTKNISLFQQATGLSISQIHGLFEGNNALYRIYQAGGSLTVSPYGSLQTSGELLEYTATGMFNTRRGGALYDNNGNTLLNWVNTFTAGIYYPEGGVNYSGVAQYLLVGVVDNNNHISFVTIEGSPTSESTDSDFRWIGAPADITLVVPASQIYGIFENADWQSDDPPGPTPEGGLLGMFDITNRFSPRTADKGLGMYMISKNMLNNMMDDLWETTFIENFNYKVFGNPLDSIISLKWFYGIKNDVPLVSGDYPLTMGNLKFPNVQTNVVSSEFAVHDFGMINIKQALQSSGRLRNNYLDYAPFIQFQLYLPFYGYVDLNPNELVDGQMGLKLNVNLLTGQGMYIVYTSGNDKHQTMNGSVDNNSQVVMVVPCALSVEIPMSVTARASLDQCVAQTISTAIGIGAGAGIGLAVGEAAHLARMGDISHSGMDMGSASRAMGSEIQQWNIAEKAQAYDTGSAVMGAAMSPSTPPTVTRNGGAFNQETGSISALTPFLYITFPIVATPNGFEDIYGNRTAVIDSLNNCDGFTQIVGVTPDSVNENAKYQGEIIALLQSGVYL